MVLSQRKKIPGAKEVLKKSVAQGLKPQANTKSKAKKILPVPVRMVARRNSVSDAFASTVRLDLIQSIARRFRVAMKTTPIALKEHNIKVLLIDDQRIVGESIRRMLLDIPGLEYRFCANPTVALAEAESFEPTVILQDLIMPGVDGIEMVRAFRQNPATANTPLIVLSSKEEPTTKAEAFAAGANDYMVKLPDKLEVIARIRYHSAAYISRLERDEAFSALEAQQRILEQELAEAANYVQSLLPASMPPGSPVPSDRKSVV